MITIYRDLEIYNAQKKLILAKDRMPVDLR